EVAPSGVRMKVADQRQMRNIPQELLDALGGAAVFLHARVTALRRLVGDGVLDDINIAAVAVPEKNSKTFPFVHFDGGYQKGPERVGRDINIHEEKTLRNRVAAGLYVIRGGA